MKNKITVLLADDHAMVREGLHALLNIESDIEVIGEAVKKLDFEFKKEKNEIEWKKIAGLRDKLIHHYFGINWEIVRDVIKNKIPELEKNMKDLLKKIA